MKTLRQKEALLCSLSFLPIFGVMLSVSIALQEHYHLLFHCALFLTGWLSWTFFEYMMHRYVMHTAKHEKPLIDFNHMYHHSHPTEIKITLLQRILLIIASTALVLISVWADNYFTLALGFLCGFPGYTLMHFLLHQKQARSIFSKHVRYHIYHHCKYPDKCFGISVTWWDDLFGTIPQDPGAIPQRIIDFFFNGEKSCPVKTDIKYSLHKK